MGNLNKRIGRRVAINGRVIDVSKITPDTLDSLEKIGALSLKSEKLIDSKTAVAAMVGVYAISAGVPVDVATAEINEHLRNGGNVDRLLQIVTKAIIEYKAPLQR